MRLRLLKLPALAFGVLVPVFSFAQESRFGPLIPRTGICRCEGSAPDWGCVLQIVQNAINVAVALGIVLIILALAYAGFTLMTAGANAEKRVQAKNVVMNSVIGLFVMLGAWLMVDFVMKAVYNPEATFSGQNIGPWNAIWSATGDDMCLAINTTPLPITSGIIDLVTGRPVGSGGGAGSCTVPANGPCSLANLQATFGSVAHQAGQICSAESGGNPQRLSQTDRTADGHAYSVGLFQINLTNSFNYRVGGRSCSAAFSGPCQGRSVTQSGSSVGRCSQRVTDMNLYRACVAAAQDPRVNIAAAKTLYDGDWGRWSTARVCSLPR